jgi:class 3 adenylate cyclase/tetratricopeptide (TPR) repeat protein
LTPPPADVKLVIRRVERLNCRSCGRTNRKDARFCDGCGQPIAEDASVVAESADVSYEADRRQLTVMFCDLVDSTRLAQRLGPEEYSDVVRAYQEACAEEIERLEGRVVQHLGDGILVYFGHPVAHEDDATRALSAALGILDRFPVLNATLRERVASAGELEIELRIGVHTGPVVVAEMGSDNKRERLAMGETPAVAARLQAFADPGQIVISSATRRLVGDAFLIDDLGPHVVKGVAEPLAVYGVRAQAREDVRPGPRAHPTPFVNRDDDLQVLLERWRAASEGRGQSLLMQGEAGIGKSRLVRELRERLRADDHVWIECSASSHHQNSALYPLIQLLRRTLFTGGELSPEKRLAAIEVALRGTDLSLDKVVPLIASLLSVKLPERYVPVPLSAEGRRRRTLQALAEWLLAQSDGQPAVLVVEDMQWMDPSTPEVLGLLLERVAGRRVLLLLTARPIFESPWKHIDTLEEHTLEPLRPEHAASMVEGVAQGKTLPADAVRQLVDKTDGVPFYVEELTRAVLESETVGDTDGRDPLGVLGVPSTLQGLLTARLDRLGSAKRVAQFAAVIGREFSFELLETAYPSRGDSLDGVLRRLEDSGLVLRATDHPARSYMFKHALMQDAAYQSLLIKERREFHAALARVLEGHFPERVESVPEEVARHYEAGGLVPEAIEYYQRAGDRALVRSAHAESIAHLTHAIELLSSLPEGADHKRRELALEITLGQALLSTRGYADPEVERVHERARELCRETGSDGPHLFQTICGLFLFHQTRAEMETAAELAEQLLVIAQKSGDPFQLQWAHLFSGLPFYYLGQFAKALHYLEEAIVHYVPPSLGPAEYIYEQDAGVAAHSMAAISLWALGYPERATAEVMKAVELGRASEHPMNLAFALVFQSNVHQMRAEPELVLAPSEEAMQLSEDQGFPMWGGMAHVLNGWALGGERGIKVFERGLAILATTGARISAPHVLGQMAEVYLGAGRLDGALRATEQGLSLGGRRQMPFWDAELYRLKGEVLLRRDPDGAKEAEECFTRALEIAREQDARSLELRSALSASALFEARGQGELGGELVAPIYRWFSEGFDAPDLRRALAFVEQG